MSDVEEVKNKLTIDQVIGSYIDIKKAGGNFKACCPFHNEKTPSFHISPDRGTYYCFGCGQKGDIFSFVQEYEGVDFKESLKQLAEKAGVKLTGNFEKKEDDDKHRRAMEAATIFFQKNLEKNKEASEYVQSRGISTDDIDTWKIGFASDEWRSLHDLFIKNGVDLKILTDVGLVKQSEKGKTYDTFRNRIMFPIADASGRIVAFTGRILKEDPNDRSTSAKYLNSPETFLFNKSKTLYGYHLAKNTIRKHDFSIIVEGQTDVIALHAIGYKNAVASSGTALTEDQFAMLSRHSDNVILALDGDAAGLKASERAWNIALSLGMNIKVAELPDGLDPADAIEKDPEIVKKAIKKSVHIVEYVSHAIMAQNLTPHQQHQKISSDVVPYLSSINGTIEQSHFVDVVSSTFSIDREAILKEVKAFIPADVTTKESRLQTTHRSAQLTQPAAHKHLPEHRLIAILNWQSQTKEPVMSVRELQSKFEKLIGAEKVDVMKQSIEGVLDQLTFKLEEMFKDKKTLETYVSELFERIEEGIAKEKINALRLELKTADESRQGDILKEIQGLSS